MTTSTTDGSSGGALPSEAAVAGVDTDELRRAGRRLVAAWTTSARALVPPGASVVDAHCHVGVDVDGSAITPGALLDQLAASGVDVATAIALHQSAGYVDANAEVLAAAHASGGRLLALHRIDASLEPDVAASRAVDALAAGARGIKWHPRAEQFGMDHHAAHATAAVADAHGVPVLIHAGRGMPHLGAGVLELARRYPRATFVLAHAAISDLAWMVDSVEDVPNVCFDTSWWRPFDLAVLLAHVPPGRILFASDAPYGTVAMGLQLTTRVARACGYGDEAMRAIMGGTAAQLLDVDGVPATEPCGLPATGTLPVEDPHLRRAASYAEAAMQLAMGRGSVHEPLELARHALRVAPGHPCAASAAVLGSAFAIADELIERPPTDDALGTAMALPRQVSEAIELLVCALAHALTPELPVAGSELLDS